MARLIFMIAALCFAASPSVAAGWETYSNQALGYNVMLPGKPVESTGIYRSDLLRGAPTHVATLTDGDTTFIALEVDTGEPEEGTAIVGELENWLNQMGRVAANSVSRLNVGMEYGRYLTVDCSDDVATEGPKQGDRARKILKDAAGLVCPNGARLTMNIFFTQGRLYAVTGMETGPDAKRASAPVRFANSLSWIGANADHARAMLEKVHPEMVNPAPAAAAPPADGH